MANQTKMNADVSKSDLSTALVLIQTYLGGGTVDKQEKAAIEALLNALPEAQVKKLKELNEIRSNSYFKSLTDGPPNNDAFFEELAAKSKMEDILANAAKGDPQINKLVLGVSDLFREKTLDIRHKFGSTELPVQQQQAYLKLLGYDIGKAGLDGIAGKDSMTQKALEKFAKEHGIDPKDTGKINQHLRIAAQDIQTPEKLQAMQEKIGAGKASADEIKSIQWLMNGAGEGMPLSLRNGKMDGIAGSETKTLIKKALQGFDDTVDFMLRKRGSPDLFDKFTIKEEPNKDLQAFYNSLTPEQRAIQKRIAELGGSQSEGEILGISSEGAHDYFRDKRVHGNIYDGGYTVKRGDNFKYEPSEEVQRLMQKFDESLTPAQIELRDKYKRGVAESNPGIHTKRSPFDPNEDSFYKRYTNLPDPNERDHLRLFRENIPDLIQKIKSPSFELTDVPLKRELMGYEDVLGKRGIKGIDMSADFRQATDLGGIGEVMGQRNDASLEGNAVRRVESMKFVVAP